MKIVITDTGIYPGTLTKEDLLINARRNIQPCSQCKGCWIRTPGICVKDDDMKYIGILLSCCDEVVIVSRCLYGGFSAFIVSVLERMRPYLLPEYSTQNEQMQNKPRYRHTFDLSVYFYGADLSKEEKETAQTAVSQTARMLFCEEYHTSFVTNAVQIGEMA